MKNENTELIRCLDIAIQVMVVMTDWNMTEVEVDDEMMSVYELIDHFRNVLEEHNG